MRLSARLIPLLLLALLAGASAASAASPRWVEHVEKFPGGISGGVRAHLDPAVEAARARALLAPATPLAAPATQGPLDNVLMNDDSSPPLPQNETAVALKPADPLVAVAAANDYVLGGLWVGHTNDGGRTWSDQRLVPVESSGNPCDGGGDPSVVYSRRDQAFYLSQLCYFNNRPDSEIVVYRSTDGGNNWSAPSTAITNRSSDGFVNGSVFYDKELLAVDNNPSSELYGRIYMTYVKFHMKPSGRSDYCPAQLASTDSFGGDWVHTAVMPSNPASHGRGRAAASFPTPVVDQRGGLNVIYANELCNNVKDPALRFRRSSNGGSSFGPLVTITKPSQYADDPDDSLPDKRGDFGTFAPSLAFNPVTRSLGVTYGNYKRFGRSGADISYQRSTDHGKHWSRAETISISRSGKAARNDQFMSALAADEAGDLHAIWFDNRRDPANKMIRTFEAFSSDDGKTWTNRNISTEDWDPNQSFFGCGCFIGDYNWIAASTEAVYPVWTDGRNTPGNPHGDTDIYTNVELAP